MDGKLLPPGGGRITGWLGLDVGGTFTDLAYIDEAGMLTRRKVPSTPSRPGQSTLDGVDLLIRVLGLTPDVLGQIQHVHSSTIATNTLIERDGATVGFITTSGFRDMLELQRLWVPNAQRYDSERPLPLVERRLVREVRGRLNADGEEIEPLDVPAVEAAAKELIDAGVDGIVICFLHSFRNDAHEAAAAAAIRSRWQDVSVSTSSEVWPQAREFERATLATIDTYVQPKIAAYVSQLTAGLVERGVTSDAFVARSNGGAEKAETVKNRPVVAVLSGPAAGVSGAARVAADAGWEKADLITVDVGGTSADIGVIRGGMPVLSPEEHIADFPILVPTVAVSSIGAGGGSLIWLDEAGSIAVGPRSLGASPGPACYGRQDDRPGMTDAFLLSGWLGTEQLLAGMLPLDIERSRRAMANVAGPLGWSVEEVADSAISIGIAMMAAETMRVLARRGVDSPTFRLVAFGGAGPLIGALLAEEVHIGEVLIPPTPGALSAFGAATANAEGDLVQPVYSLLSRLSGTALPEAATSLAARSRAWLDEVAPGARLVGQTYDWAADMHYDGQGYDVTVPLRPEWLETSDIAAIAEAFHRAHEATFGHVSKRDIWLKELRVHVTGIVPKPASIRLAPTDEPATLAPRKIRLGGEIMTAPVYFRDSLTEPVEGPAIIEQLDTTTLVPPGWRATIAPGDNLILSKI
ncbi:MAG: hydantoinase/oxoprolinase family protein [Rhodobacteraceae bacterium]|nr:hydantoinase/oxoprolinase family protein [Paracoccaceae bacterium]